MIGRRRLLIAPKPWPDGVGLEDTPLVCCFIHEKPHLPGLVHSQLARVDVMERRLHSPETDTEAAQRRTAGQRGGPATAGATSRRCEPRRNASWRPPHRAIGVASGMKRQSLSLLTGQFHLIPLAVWPIPTIRAPGLPRPHRRTRWSVVQRTFIASVLIHHHRPPEVSITTAGSG